MTKTKALYIGLMSGTSVDGVDAGLVDFSKPQPKLIASHHTPYDNATKASILALCQPGENEIDRLGELDMQLGHIFAETTLALIRSAQIDRKQVSAIGSHGQTVRHRPSGKSPFTLQIGDPNIVAEKTGITTVGDLRRRDMAAGGQGAPLAPAFHRHAFFSSSERRCIVNIGGISNISVLTDQPEQTTGYDTGPGNVLMDAWIMQHKDRPYDNDGFWASGGKIDKILLNNLLAHSFFEKSPPKSTGREDFDMTWLLSKVTKHAEPQSVQSTLCELTAATIARAAKVHNCEALYTCGGGANNRYLMQRLSSLLPGVRVATTDALGMPVDWVETGLCAWLAKQTLNGHYGNVPNVTGADSPTILGAIYPAHR